MMGKHTWVVWMWLGAAMVGWAQQPWQELVDLQGRRHRPWQDPKTKAVVLVFVNVDCPIANFYQPRLRQLAQRFEPRGVRFFQIHCDPAVTAQQAQEHAQQFHITMPVVMDSKQRIARALGAKITPEVFVLDRRGQVVYRGRIDDTYVDYGKKRPRPLHHDLADALEALLAGRPVPRPRTKPVGCFIIYQQP